MLPDEYPADSHQCRPCQRELVEAVVGVCAVVSESDDQAHRKSESVRRVCREEPVEPSAAFQHVQPSEEHPRAVAWPESID